MKSKLEYLIETDILADHLTFKGSGKSVLEKAMIRGICFTTVINASELYFAAKDLNEKAEIDKLLRTMKVLGMNARYCLSVYKYKDKVRSLRDAWIILFAKINNLPVLTNNKEKYKFAGIDLIDYKTL